MDNSCPLKNTLELLNNTRKSLKDDADKKFTEINDEIKKIEFLIDGGYYGNGYAEHTRLSYEEMDGLDKERITVCEKRDKDIVLALNRAISNLALIFETSQIEYENFEEMWLDCKLCCKYRYKLRVSMHLYVGDTSKPNSRTVICGDCYDKIDAVKSKIHLIPSIIELPEIQNIICETFLSVV
jgi:hypothetical protein